MATNDFSDTKIWGNLLSTGNIGAGTDTPGFKISIGNTSGDKLAVYESGGASFYGLGISTSRMYLKANATEALSLYSGGNVGVGQAVPTAVLHIKAGTASASSAPLKFTAGVVNTVSEAGAIEFDGTDFFINI